MYILIYLYMCAMMKTRSVLHQAPDMEASLFMPVFLLSWVLALKDCVVPTFFSEIGGPERRQVAKYGARGLYKFLKHYTLTPHSLTP